MRIYLAGAEAWNPLLTDLGVKNQLFTFIYLRDKLTSVAGRSMLARMRIAKDKGYSFMLDSGAFTYMEKTKAGEGDALPPPKAYFEEYLRFVIDQGDLFDVVTELDIDGIEGVSLKDVNRWTDRLILEAGGGPRVMPVYHSNRGRVWLKDWLSDPASPLIGMGSDVGGTWGLPGRGPTMAFIGMAHRYGKYVHGFGQTRMKTDARFTLFDSIDSSTWLRADRFGGTMIFMNGKLIILDHLHKHHRALYRRYYESHGLNFKKIMQDDLHENRMATVICWKEMLLDFERKWYLRTAGRHPHLYQYWKENGRAPPRHWMIGEGGEKIFV